MPVHVHSEGGGATHFMLDCIEDTEKVTGNLDHVVFHSDCPISTQMDVSRSVYMAETRALVDGGMVTQRNPSEAIDREQSLKAMTINVARAWRQEDRMGSIEFGKLANMAVFDCNFPHDDLDKVACAKVIATIVDGEEVYRA